jgi:hypothetical protein
VESVELGLGEECKRGATYFGKRPVSITPYLPDSTDSTDSPSTSQTTSGLVNSKFELLLSQHRLGVSIRRVDPAAQQTANPSWTAVVGEQRQARIAVVLVQQVTEIAEP